METTELRSKPARVAEAWCLIVLGGQGPDDQAHYDPEAEAIHIDPHAEPRRGVELAIHEAAHRVCPYLTEDTINRLGVSAANALLAYLDLKGLGLHPKPATPLTPGVDF